MNRVLVWHQGALGDLLLSIPALHAIRSQGAGASLHLVSRTDVASLLILSGLAGSVSSPEDGMFGALFRDDEEIPQRLRNFLSGFDSGVIFTRRRNAHFLKKIAKVIPSLFFLITFPPEGVREHVSIYQLKQLGIAGEWWFSLSGICEDGPSSSSTPVMSIHPGSGGWRKCWPLENFLELALSIHGGERWRFQFIFGPAEKADAVKKTARFISDYGIDAQLVCGRPLLETARWLKQSDLYIGNDSGISHMAALLGVPSIVLFGPTDDVVWRPLGQNVRIVRSGLGCSPCSEERFRFCSHIRCMKEISVRDVIRAVAALKP